MKNTFFVQLALGLMLLSCRSMNQKQAYELESLADQGNGSGDFAIPDGIDAIYSINELAGFNIVGENKNEVELLIPMWHCIDDLGPVLYHKIRDKNKNTQLFINPIGFRNTEKAKRTKCAKQKIAKMNIKLGIKPVNKKDLKIIIANSKDISIAQHFEKVFNPLDPKKLIPIPKETKGMGLAFGEVESADLIEPKCIKAPCDKMANIELKYLLNCSSLLASVTSASYFTDPRNDDPNIHLFIGTLQFNPNVKQKCITATEGRAFLSLNGNVYNGVSQFDRDDVFFENMKGNFDNLDEASDLSDLIGGRVTCMAYWSGFLFSRESGQCFQSGASGCSNPFPYKTLKECTDANNISEDHGEPICGTYFTGFKIQDFQDGFQACEYAQSVGCKNPFPYKTLKSCLSENPKAANFGKPIAADPNSCDQSWKGYVLTNSIKKCIPAEARGCLSPFIYNSLTECRLKNNLMKIRR